MEIKNKIYIFIKLLKKVRNIHEYFLDYFGLKKDLYCLKLYGGIKIILRGGTTDRMIFNDIFLREEYSLKDKNKFNVVVDVGAHIGLFSLFISNNSKKIICFEPQKENFQILKKNIKINNLKNIEIHNCALSSKDGKIKLYAPSGKNYDSFSVFEKNNKKFEWIESKNPKKILKKIKKVDLLKLDCEGCEFSILPLLNFKKIDKICMEYHLSENKSKKFIMDILKKNFNQIKEKKYNSKLGLLYSEK